MTTSHLSRIAVAAAVLFGALDTPARALDGQQAPITLQIRSVSADTLRLGDRLRIVVGNLDSAVAANQVDPKTLILSLNGYALPGLRLNRSQDTLVYTLERGDSSRAAWAALLGAPNARLRRMSVGIMRSGGAAIPQPRQVAITFRLFSEIWLLAAVAVAVVLGWVCVRLVLRRRIAGERRQVRIPPSILKGDTQTKVDDGDPNRALSLARLQLLWWTYLIVCGFLFVWLLTSDYNGIVTSQALLLMGISAVATTVSKGVGAASRSEALRRIAELDPTARTSAVELRRLVGRTGKPSGTSTWRELFETESGLSVSRLQFAGWSIVLGLVWIYAVYARLSFPAFDSTLLWLMGISAGTYAGLKVTEVQDGSAATKQTLIGAAQKNDGHSRDVGPSRFATRADSHAVHANDQSELYKALGDAFYAAYQKTFIGVG